MDGDILVPFSPEAVLSGVNRQLKPEEYLWYKRRLPDEVKPEKGSRWILHFGAVDQCAVVYINGKKQGKHVGGYLPFSYDITEALKEEKNLLTVKVRDYSETCYYSRGKQKLKMEGCSIRHRVESGRPYGLKKFQSVISDILRSHLFMTSLL